MIQSINPFNHEIIAEHTPDNNSVVCKKIAESHHQFRTWRKSTGNKRKELLTTLAAALLTKRDELARIITLEMGKPIVQSRAEIEKCAVACEYYSQNLEDFLTPKTIKTDASKSYVLYEPMGVWLAIMPWNFPFWQVFRCAIPAIAAGNTVLLKHASNVWMCAAAIEGLFREVSGGMDLFKTLFISADDVEKVISDERIHGVSFTGSTDAGSMVAASCGRYIKPSVLELGGSNAFIVMADADMKTAVEHALTGRFQNAGQSCISAKRFLIHEKVYDEFMHGFMDGVNSLKSGDPMDENTGLGPLAMQKFIEPLHCQVDQAVNEGARITVGGNFNGSFYAPTILEEITAQNIVFRDEVFGPVAPVMKFKKLEEAIEISNSTRFGLGVSVITSDHVSIETEVSEFSEGSVFINAIVKSDPRLPFGGVKDSGYGRELSLEGFREFVQAKTIYVR